MFKVVAYGTVMAAVVLGPMSAQAQLDDPIPEPIKKAGAPIRLVTVATGMTAPNWGTAAPGQPGRLFVTDQDGILWAVDLSTGE